jgi:hypothetical protein
MKNQTLKEIDLYLEEFYPKSVGAGNAMAIADLGNTQIRGLETLITSASRFSEIINYIKNQTGKDKKGKWLQIGPLLLGQLEQLENKANEMGREDPETKLEIKMKLARGWAKQVVTHYLYSMSLKGK